MTIRETELNSAGAVLRHAGVESVSVTCVGIEVAATDYHDAMIDPGPNEPECAYCAVRPAIGEPPIDKEPQCFFCWDTGYELSDEERHRRVAALTADAKGAA